MEVDCRNNLSPLRYCKFDWTQSLVGGCHPELQCAQPPPPPTPNGSGLWAPHDQSHCRVRGLMDGLTAANVTSCQPLNRGAVSGGCRQPVPCQGSPLVWEWRLPRDWLSLITQRQRATEESVACQPQTSSSQTSNCTQHKVGLVVYTSKNIQDIIVFWLCS